MVGWQDGKLDRQWTMPKMQWKIGGDNKRQTLLLRFALPVNAATTYVAKGKARYTNLDFIAMRFNIKGNMKVNRPDDLQLVNDEVVVVAKEEKYDEYDDDLMIMMASQSQIVLQEMQQCL